MSIEWSKFGFSGLLTDFVLFFANNQPIGGSASLVAATTTKTKAQSMSSKPQ